MLTRVSLVVAHALLLSMAVVLAGCSRPAEDPVTGGSPETPAPEESEAAYDPHDMPLTEEQKSDLREETAQFPAAVTKIAEFRDAVQNETSGGIPENPFEAHQALDKVDFVLQRLPEIASSYDVPKEHWEEINLAAKDLRTSFEQVHQNIDDQQDPDFAGVAAEIEEKIGRLQEIAQSLPAADGEEE